MSAREALTIAEEKELDLVKISPNANPPVCKKKESRKNQKVQEIKEIQLSMTIDVGDVNVKAKQCNKFLAAGNKVKVTIRMHGRQMAHASMSVDVMNNFFELVKENGVMEKKPLTEGRNVWMMLAPIKDKR